MDLDVAADFPKARYLAVEERIAHYLGALQASAAAVSGVSEYAGGWNAVILRFRAADECGISAIAALARGGAPPNDVRYEQERDLFGFFANVLSTIESCCYAIYHVARIAGVPGFDRAPLAQIFQ